MPARNGSVERRTRRSAPSRARLCGSSEGGMCSRHGKAMDSVYGSLDAICCDDSVHTCDDSHLW
eukprot:549403-Prymnesium_polylepis.1